MARAARCDEPIEGESGRPVTAVGGQQARDIQAGHEDRSAVKEIRLSGVGQPIEIGSPRSDEDLVVAIAVTVATTAGTMTSIIGIPTDTDAPRSWSVIRT